jgi:hypothetical protein
MMRSMRRSKHGLWGVALGTLILGACASTGDPGTLWSRSYALPEEVVYDAVVQVLDDAGYRVESDRERGRVLAEPGHDSSPSRATLTVGITAKRERVIVDVQVRADAQQRAVPRSTDAAVREFLYALDAYLQGFHD